MVEIVKKRSQVCVDCGIWNWAEAPGDAPEMNRSLFEIEMRGRVLSLDENSETGQVAFEDFVNVE